MKKGQLLGSARDRMPRRKQRNHAFGWVSISQLHREIGEAHRRWLADRAMLPLGSSSGSGRRGHPGCPKAIAALAAWRAAGSPPRGLKAICAQHGANYYTVINRRIREEGKK